MQDKFLEVEEKVYTGQLTALEALQMYDFPRFHIEHLGGLYNELVGLTLGVHNKHKIHYMLNGFFEAHGSHIAMLRYRPLFSDALNALTHNERVTPATGRAVTALMEAIREDFNFTARSMRSLCMDYVEAVKASRLTF